MAALPRPLDEISHASLANSCAARRCTPVRAFVPYCDWASLALSLLLAASASASESKSPTTAPANDEQALIERDVAVSMRDGVVLRGDVYRPRTGDRFPVLVYRTPYGKDDAGRDYSLHREAVRRGYAVLLQDVRGRYASDGVFDPYRQEGRDGYDTIEWAARQPWSNGKVGTFGLSYPGAVQWLAALERPPHLLAMVPAMTFSSPRHFFYANGVFDLSWLPWIYVNIAPDARRRLDLPGTRDSAAAAREWRSDGDSYLSWLPLRELPHLHREAPFYFEWLAHPPEDPWWDWAEIRGQYARVTAAVLNLSGWYDEAYGPEGAVTNFQGLLAARRGERNARTNLIIGPWVHGVSSTATGHVGDLDLGPQAAIDYDRVVLDFLDRHVRGVDNGFSTAAPVRYFEMGTNTWRDSPTWPPAHATSTRYLAASGGNGTGRLELRPPTGGPTSELVSDPRTPVRDPYREFGPHDYRSLAARKDVLTFDTEPFASDQVVTGAVTAVIHASCDCRDFDLWVRLQDVRPDGTAINLMSPGNDVLRASYRQGDTIHELLNPGEVYEFRLPTLLTSNRVAKGHRLRAQLSASFAPHLSRNLQTGASEATSATMQTARIRIHHEPGHASALLLPVTEPAAGGDPP
jgi:putative CocE/NonD family hydrolase